MLATEVALSPVECLLKYMDPSSEVMKRQLSAKHSTQDKAILSHSSQFRPNMFSVKCVMPVQILTTQRFCV